MSCDCTVKNTTFANELINVFNENTEIKYNLRDLIPAFDIKYSGIWQPIFFDKTPKETETNTKKWTKIDDGNEECESATPEGLGIKELVSISNPKLRNWTVTGNLELQLDWVVDFSKYNYNCKTYTNCVLFWYRYYDIGRSNNKEFRLFPGIDLYVSDGDMAIINGDPVVTPNLSGTLNQIRASLISAGFNANIAKYNAAVLSTGPQIDRITEILSGPDNGIEYERTSLGLLYPQLSGMSNKRYSDIGQDNYIVTKTDLLHKLSTKYGVYITVPESSQATLKSNFLSSTGPNINIQLNTELYRSEKEKPCAYDVSYYLNNEIKLEAYQSDEIFTVTNPAEDEDDEPTETKYNINYVKFGNRTIGYHLSEKESGVFNPDINNIKLHGLGGVDFSTSLTRDVSCVNSINSTTFNGPYFLQKSSYPSGLDGTPSNIFINVKTYNNSQIKFVSGINIAYLRSDSKPECEAFVKNNDTCKCFSLMDLNPEASGKQELSNEEDLLFIPSTSMYYLPSGQYYGGLTQQQVNEYGIVLPDHPSPGTPLPKSHIPIFPKEESCSYTIDGCGSKTISLNIDYPGELVLEYQSPSGHFSLKWNEETKENEDPYFATTAGTLCLTKTTQSPSLVYIEVEVPESNPNIQWAISLSGVQTDYASQATPNGLNINAKKGFFHPNFGWTYNPKYFNKSPIIPNHNGLSYIGKPGAGASANNYQVYVRYSNTDGPCPGGHGCNRAKFNVYVNDTLIGVANLNNAGGPEDEGNNINGDRTSILTLPSSVRFRSGKALEILIQCAYDSGCHSGIAWVQIINNKGEIIYDSCIATEKLITLELEESLNNYFYNSYAMYQEEYLPGYNFMYSISGLSDQQKNKINDSSYIGIKTAGNSYYVNNNFNKIKYDLLESMILDNVPFEYINIDHAYGYVYNDFTFTRSPGSNILTIGSSSNNERILNYFDDPNIRQEPITLISSTDYSKKVNVTVTEILDTNQIRINTSPDDNYFLAGFLIKTKNDGQYNQSIIVYRPHITYDDKLTIGKWGNMSYGYAGFMAARYEGIDLYRQDKFLNQEWYGEPLNNQWYNNSIIRNGITQNTSYSWGCPISFVNNYNKQNQTNFYPLSRIFNSFNDNGDRRYQVINHSSNLEIKNETYIDGDKIIAKGSINNINGYIYLGSLTTPLKIIVKLNITDSNAGFLIFKYKGTEIFRGRVEDVNEDDEIVIEFEKNDVLPIYGELSVEKNPTFCSKTTSTSDTALNAQTLFIQTYRVEVDLTRLELLNESRISYYQHEPNPSLLGQSSTNAVNNSTDILNLNKNHVRSLNKDFNPFLDLHIFEDDDTQKPIISDSGIIYFEDFFQPKSQNYLLNKMEVPYSDDLYWIDLPIQGQWNLLTEKGILLTQNTTYKVLKKLEYECKDDASKCSEKYPEDICEKSYEIKKSDIYDALGLVGSDQNLVEISEVVFPAHCDTINHCCKTEEECKSEDCEKYTDQADIDRCYQDREKCLSEREDCLEAEQEAKDDCKKFWKEDSKYDISCKDVCPTGSVSGIIEIKTLEYYLLKVKDNLNPPLNNATQIQLTFLPQSDSIDIPCSQLSFPNIGSTFLYNYSCSQTEKDCQTIIPKNNSVGSEFIDGTFLDLSVLKNNNATLNTTPNSIIIDNEIRYRDNIPHNNIISLPFHEYDPQSTSKYLVSHDFTIRSKECVGAGKLFDLSIDNLSCEFSIVDTPSGLVLESSCFDDIVLDAKEDRSIIVYKTVCEGEWDCAANGIDECKEDDCQPYYCTEWSCEDAAEYLKSINENYELIKCEELTLPEDYYLACRQCGTAVGGIDCSVSISYSDPLPRECHCPPGSKLVGAVGQEICEYEYKVLELKGQNQDYSDYSGVVTPCSTAERTIKTSVAPECFGEIIGPSKETLDNYDNSCPKGTEFISQSSYYQIISIDNNGINKAQNDLNFAAQTEGYRMCCEFEKANKAYTECTTSCSEQASNCQGDNCAKQSSACYCNCSTTYFNAINDIALSQTIYYVCNGYCNISDYINYAFPYANCGWGWGWGSYYWCGDETCYATATSANSPCGPERCCPDTSCDGYNSCADIEKRLKPKHYSTVYECKVDENGYTYSNIKEVKCEDLSISSIGTVKSSYDILTRKVTSYNKTKKNVLSQKEKLDNVSTVKVFDKEFRLTYKVNEDCDPACEKNEVCCEQECISEDEICCENKIDININLKFEIYDNLIVGIINNDQYNKIYHIKTAESFKCPKITFKSHNDNLYMCNSVESECLTCFAGAQDV